METVTRRISIERINELRKLYRQQANAGSALPWSEDLADALDELADIRSGKNQEAQ
jgi:hypothetical protein